MTLILASESARRVELLRRAGYRFEARRSGFPEVELDDPRETALANARGKAGAVAAASPEAVVLAADTVVYLPGGPDGGILGQARREEDVRRMLGLLQGRMHEVHSGVAVAAGGRIAVRHAVTEVRMRSLRAAEVEEYARCGEGVGKAGGYALQGRAAVFVEWIFGDYTNVVGLPLPLTVRMLRENGIEPG
ncbi:Maf-like protein [Rubrobacter xylanophilus]|uniref:dTTP/UTP pyrophosphatase n=1 Tax=Rubrobacter xylanophilus TaxID=49319 RepID=A0A510HGB7_9ACTN|nr:Maf family protein [Rubrobacter xylanophilus]BBL78989.1 Maf-like protein [Rubrobacter xylanophilus]